MWKFSLQTKYYLLHFCTHLLFLKTCCFIIPVPSKQYTPGCFKTVTLIGYKYMLLHAAYQCCCLWIHLFSVIIYAPESNFGYWNGGKGVDLIEIHFIFVSFSFDVVLCLLVVLAIFNRCMIITIMILFVFLQQLMSVDLFVHFCWVWLHCG